MADPHAMQSPPGQGSAPPGYGYPQQGYQAPPQGFGGSAPPAAWNPGPAMAPARPMNWEMISFGLRAVGFLLIGIGAMVAIMLSQVPASCLNTTSTCFTAGSSFYQGVANGFMWGKFLVALGALVLGLGCGVKLHWVLRAPVGGTSDTMAWVIVERLVNYGILIGTVVLFWLLIFGIPAIGSGGVTLH